MSVNTVPVVAWSRVRLGPSLGEGAFGEIYEANVAPFGRCAVKVPRTGQRLGVIEEYRAEAQRMAHAQHDNVLTVFALADRPDGFAIIMARMEMSLKKALELCDDTGNAPLLDGVARETLAYQASAGLEALHRAGVLHRDIKSDNALVNVSGVGGIKLCWTDFGVSRMGNMSTLSPMQTMTQVGTLGYMAPEISVLEGSSSRMEYSRAVDVYAFGVVLGEMVSGKPPCFPDQLGISFLPNWMHEKNFNPSVCVDTRAFRGHMNVANLLLELIRLCTARESHQRPQMATVVNRFLDSAQLESAQASTSASTRAPPQQTISPSVENRPRLCKICMDAQVNTLIQPCRHSCMCDTCAAELLHTRGSCPLCRARCQSWTVIDPSAPEAQHTFIRQLAEQTTRGRVENSEDEIFQSEDEESSLDSGVFEESDESILRAMDDHITDASVQLQAFASLRTRAASGGTSMILIAQGAGQKILRAMDSHRANASVQESACFTLRAFAISQQVALVQEGAGQKILRAMGVHISNARVQERACHALSFLSSSKDNQATLMDLGIVWMILRSMDHHIANPKVQKWGCSTLRNLASYFVNLGTLMEQGVPQKILRAMNIPNADILRIACHTLALFSRHSGICIALMELDAAQKILHVMDSNHAKKVDVQKMACWAVRNLAENSNDSNRTTLIELGADRKILRAMDKHIANARVQEHVCSALSYLACSRDNQAALMQQGACQKILRAMDNHITNALVQEHACSALSYLADENSNSKTILLAQSAPQKILRAMDNHIRNAKVQEYASHALVHLTSRYDSQVGLMELGIVQRILRAMDNFISNASIQDFACRALAFLAYKSENKVTLMEQGTAQRVQRAIENHSTNARALISMRDAQYVLDRLGIPQLSGRRNKRRRMA